MKLQRIAPISSFLITFCMGDVSEIGDSRIEGMCAGLLDSSTSPARTSMLCKLQFRIHYVLISYQHSFSLLILIYYFLYNLRIMPNNTTIHYAHNLNYKLNFSYYFLLVFLLSFNTIFRFAAIV